MVFRWFAEERVDLALVEVGLGGRLDATHAWDGGVAAITNVDLDHMDRLGPTIGHIAREKAAIIERGDVAVTGATGEALAIVRRRAARLGRAADRRRAAPRSSAMSRDGIEVELPRLGRTTVGLRGRHQAANAAVADAVLDALAAAGIADVPAAARRAGYATARWPGRLELLSVDGRDVLLDGAHNPAGAAALATALDDLRPFLDAGPAHARHRFDGRQGRRRDRRPRSRVAGALAGGAGHRDAARRAAGPAAEDLAERWRAAGARQASWTVAAEPDPARPWTARIARRRRAGRRRRLAVPRRARRGVARRRSAPPRPDR